MIVKLRRAATVVLERKIVRTILWTPAGHAWLEAEALSLKQRKTRTTRKELEDAFAVSLSEGKITDLAISRDAAAAFEERRARLSQLFDRVRPHPVATNLDVAGFGLMITVATNDGETEREQSFVLGGEGESIVELDYQIVGGTAPMGRAVRGKEVGDEGSFRVLNRNIEFEILRIEHAPSRESLLPVQAAS